jgi:hypothetical protein
MPVGNGHRRTSARTATAQREIPWIACGTEHRIERVFRRPQTRGRWSCRSRWRRFESLDDKIVLVSNVVLVNERPPSRANCLDSDSLDRLKHLSSRASVVACWLGTRVARRAADSADGRTTVT